MNTAGRTFHPDGIAGRNSWLVQACLIAFVAGTLALFFVRLSSVLGSNGMIDASGVEGAAILSVELICKGASIYHRMPEDPNPYIFNWLFYWAYPAFVRLFTDCGGNLNIAARMFTLLLGIAGSLGLMLVARLRGASWPMALFLGVAVAGPAVGWWLFSVRPDLAAFTMALGAFITARFAVDGKDDARTVLLLTIAILFAALAWSFKQTFLVVLGAAGLYLLICLPGKKLKLIAMGVLVLVVALGFWWVTHDPAIYRHTVVFPRNRFFLFDLMKTNVGGFLVKSAPYSIVILLVLNSWRRRWETDALSLASIMFLLMTGGLLVVMGAASGFYGAADSYLFPALAAMLAFLAYEGGAVGRDFESRSAFAVACLVGLALSLAILGGAIGNARLSDRDASFVQRFKADLQASPHPRLVIDDNLAREVNSPGADERLLDYDLYRLGPKLWSVGPGLHRRIREGEYGTVVMEDRFAFDVDLSMYRKTHDYGRVSMYVRK